MSVKKTKISSKSAAGSSTAPALSHERIVAEALDILDREGLENFSLRRVAKSLGVYPTALYWYVGSKDKLLAEAIALAFQPEEVVASTPDWRADLRRLFRSWRAAIQRHPNIAPAVGTQLSSNTDVRYELVERILRDLSRAGFEGVKLMQAYNSVIASLVGFVAQEYASIPREGLDKFQSEMKDRLLGVDTKTYPLLAANIPILANRAFILRWQNGVEAPLDDSFEFFIDLVIGGLAAAVSTPEKVG